MAVLLLFLSNLLYLSIPADVYLSCFWTHDFWSVFALTFVLFDFMPLSMHWMDGGVYLVVHGVCIHRRTMSCLAQDTRSSACLVKRGLRAENEQKLFFSWMCMNVLCSQYVSNDVRYWKKQPCQMLIGHTLWEASFYRT